MTTEQKNVEICLMLGFTLSNEENDWSSNPFYCPPKWFMDATYYSDYEVESNVLCFDDCYDWQLTAIDWIEEKYNRKFAFWIEPPLSKSKKYQVAINIEGEPNYILHSNESRKEAIFESLFWLSQNYKNYL